MSADHNDAPLHLKRNLIGGVVGNVLEWYDFAVFGYFAPIIGAQFFPSENKLAALLNACFPPRHASAASPSGITCRLRCSVARRHW